VNNTPEPHVDGNSFKIYLLSIFLLFSVFRSQFILYTHFDRVPASRAGQIRSRIEYLTPTYHSVLLYLL